jgi:hypothetical protein
MRAALFHPSAEGEMRLLLLIDAFSRPNRSLEGRTKLAKLDFFLRYPSFFARALALRAGKRPSRAAIAATKDAGEEGETIESRMVRYRYGPWDPAYFALLGRLIGRGLLEPVSEPRGIGYRTTETGAALADRVAETPEWAAIRQRAELLRQYFDITGEGLKEFIYAQFPEVSQARWGKAL